MLGSVEDEIDTPKVHALHQQIPFVRFPKWAIVSIYYAIVLRSAAFFFHCRTFTNEDRPLSHIFVFLLCIQLDKAQGGEIETVGLLH